MEAFQDSGGHGFSVLPVRIHQKDDHLLPGISGGYIRPTKRYIDRPFQQFQYVLHLRYLYLLSVRLRDREEDRLNILAASLDKAPDKVIYMMKVFKTHFLSHA